MAAYDHDLPVPTGQWQPGRTITYARRIFVPELPYVGDVPLVLGVSSSGARLRLVGSETADRLYRVATLKLHAHRTLLVQTDGWHPGVPDAGFTWTGPTASLTLRNPRQDSVLYLRVSGHPDLGPGPQLASIGIGFLGEPAVAKLLEPVVGDVFGHGVAVGLSVVLAYALITY